jgi:hypothetical protein
MHRASNPSCEKSHFKENLDNRLLSSVLNGMGKTREVVLKREPGLESKAEELGGQRRAINRLVG